MLMLFAALLAVPRLLALLEATANALLSHLSLLFVYLSRPCVVVAAVRPGRTVARHGLARCW
ncbi:hypothetical protein LP420_36270 [Massilia sp. B-10]|nr:hypothetical protein LP420_36270 [Massilia sp. B-10]